MVSVFDFDNDTRWACKPCRALHQRNKRDDRTRDREFARRWRYLIHYAHDRARKKGLPFDLNEHEQEIKNRVEAGNCELTGLPFNTEHGGGRGWNSPSLDRIEPAKGYVYGNIRVILYGLNMAINDWGEDVLRHMTEYLHRD